ncbi:thioredoxin-disulfide reductase [Schaalia sp. ZJ1691]|uniref:thioredoxin-disulfide reductase n=1 Tax=Schaalia sp. ZJ1691 TaxID=2709404 RepID=UPI0013EA815F|nr:thioredoxin-disulfide reductase [Schaalia sp. ZJ1691]
MTDFAVPGLTSLPDVAPTTDSDTVKTPPTEDTVSSELLAAPVPADAKIHNVIIVGSGPAGYTAAIYTARAGLHPLVLAGALSAGGALMNTTEVENFPGFPEGIQGPDLMGNMSEQAEKFGADIRYEDVTAVKLDGDIKVVAVDDELFYARAVIVATGSEYRHMNVPGEDELSGRGVSYCATCDGFFFRDKHLAVIGGGDSAMEEATFLTNFASRVTVVHRRDELRASKVMADRATANPKIDFRWNATVDSVNGSDAVTSVTLRSTVDNSTSQLDVDGVFVAIGHLPRTAFLAGQVALDDAGYIIVDEPSTRTNLSGVFACGDAVDHTYRQAITAAGSGCRAALDAERWLASLEDAKH